MAVEGYSNTSWAAAGSEDLGRHNAVQLFTAEDDIKTEPGRVKAGQKLAVLTIVMFDADNELVPWDGLPATAAKTRVLATDIDTSATGTNADAYTEVYAGACFNPDLLVWPAALRGSHDAQRAAIAPASFRVKHLL